MADVDEHTIKHLYRVFYRNLRMSGSGTPATALVMIRDILALCPFHDDGPRKRAALSGLIGTDGAVHFVLSVLVDADLIEYGSSITSSWITDTGRWVLCALRRAPDLEMLLDQMQEIGGPNHYECDSGCWKLPPEA